MKRKLAKAQAPEPIELICKGDHARAARDLLRTVGDKWSVILVVTLSRTPRNSARFSELNKLMDGISQRMLTATLRNLERDGFIKREAFPEIPPRVEYELTELGMGLLKPMKHLVEWITDNWPRIYKARADFDENSETKKRVLVVTLETSGLPNASRPLPLFLPCSSAVGTGSCIRKRY